MAFLKSPKALIFAGALGAIILALIFWTGPRNVKDLRRVSPDIFEEAYQTGSYTAIDLRTPAEFAEGRIFADAKLGSGLIKLAPNPDRCEFDHSKKIV